jgi:hypothetical protein
MIKTQVSSRVNGPANLYVFLDQSERSDKVLLKDTCILQVNRGATPCCRKNVLWNKKPGFSPSP